MIGGIILNRKKIKTLKTKYGNLYFKVNNYDNNNRLAIEIYNKKNDEFFDTLTINIDIPIISINQGFINDNLYDFAPDLIKKLKKEKIISQSLGFINYNYGRYEQVDFNLEKLKEYDAKGVDNYLEIAKENKNLILFSDFFEQDMKI